MATLATNVRLLPIHALQTHVRMAASALIREATTTNVNAQMAMLAHTVKINYRRRAARTPVRTVVSAWRMETSSRASVQTCMRASIAKRRPTHVETNLV